MERNEILARLWQAAETGDLVPLCAWCGRLRIDAEWIEPPKGALATVDQEMTLSHSICPACSEDPWPPPERPGG